MLGCYLEKNQCIFLKCPCFLGPIPFSVNSRPQFVKWRASDVQNKHKQFSGCEQSLLPEVHIDCFFLRLIRYRCSFVQSIKAQVEQITLGSILFCPGVMTGPSNCARRFVLLSKAVVSWGSGTESAHLFTHSCQNVSGWWPVHIYESYIYPRVHPLGLWIIQEKRKLTSRAAKTERDTTFFSDTFLSGCDAHNRGDSQIRVRGD